MIRSNNALTATRRSWIFRNQRKHRGRMTSWGVANMRRKTASIAMPVLSVAVVVVVAGCNFPFLGMPRVTRAPHAEGILAGSTEMTATTTSEAFSHPGSKQESLDEEIGIPTKVERDSLVVGVVDRCDQPSSHGDDSGDQGRRTDNLDNSTTLYIGTGNQVGTLLH